MEATRSITIGFLEQQKRKQGWGEGQRVMSIPNGDTEQSTLVSTHCTLNEPKNPVDAIQ